MDTKDVKKILETYSLNKNYYNEITTDLVNYQDRLIKANPKLHILDIYNQTIKDLKAQSEQTLLQIKNIESAINSLTQPSKSILYFKYVKHISYEQIANKMSYSVQRIYQLLNIALAEFATNYQQQLSLTIPEKSLE